MFSISLLTILIVIQTQTDNHDFLTEPSSSSVIYISFVTPVDTFFTMGSTTQAIWNIIIIYIIDTDSHLFSNRILFVVLLNIPFLIKYMNTRILIFLLISLSCLGCPIFLSNNNNNKTKIYQSTAIHSGIYFAVNIFILLKQYQ